MSFLILKFSSGSLYHSKERLNSYHVLWGPLWSGLQLPLWPHYLSPQLMPFIHTWPPCWSWHAKYAPISGPLHLVYLFFLHSTSTFSKEPRSYFFIFLRTSPKLQLAASPSNHPLSLYTALFFSIKKCHLALNGLCLLGVSSQRNISIRTKPFTCLFLSVSLAP